MQNNASWIIRTGFVYTVIRACFTQNMKFQEYGLFMNIKTTLCLCNPPPFLRAFRIFTFLQWFNTGIIIVFLLPGCSWSRRKPERFSKTFKRPYLGSLWPCVTGGRILLEPKHRSKRVLHPPTRHKIQVSFKILFTFIFFFSFGAGQLQKANHYINKKCKKEKCSCYRRIVLYAIYSITSFFGLKAVPDVSVHIF